MAVNLIQGECLDVLRGLPSNSFGSVVADPPAGIGFMGKEWDKDKGGRDHWIAWLASILRECRWCVQPGHYLLCWAIPRTSHWTGMAIEDAGWKVVDRVAHLFGQGFPKGKVGLKPSCEDWWLAFNPEGGRGPLNIDDCRISDGGPSPSVQRRKGKAPGVSVGASGWVTAARPASYNEDRPGESLGRWPANVVVDPWIGEQLDEQASPTRPSLFYYCSKASKSDRGEGNTHPTAKNTRLMDWLIRLITPPGKPILNPFSGSGSTLVAADRAGYDITGIERELEYVEIARRRLGLTAD